MLTWRNLHIGVCDSAIGNSAIGDRRQARARSDLLWKNSSLRSLRSLRRHNQDFDYSEGKSAISSCVHVGEQYKQGWLQKMTLLVY